MVLRHSEAKLRSYVQCDSHARLPPGRPSTTYKDAICRGSGGMSPRKFGNIEPSPSESGSEAL